MSTTISDIRAQFPDRIPVRCSIGKLPGSLPRNLDKRQYLVPRELTIGEFAYTLRKYMNLNKSQSLLLYVKNELPAIMTTFDELDKRYNNGQGVLDITYCGENTFG